MANCAISRVQRDGRKKVLEMDDQSRMAAIAKIRYIAKRPTLRLTAST